MLVQDANKRVRMGGESATYMQDRLDRRMCSKIDRVVLETWVWGAEIRFA